MRYWRHAAVGAAALLCGDLSSPAQAEDQVSRGKYLVTVMGCNDCHTPGYFLGKPDFARALSGSDVGFEVPAVGIRWGANLTPDPETGLGKWSDAEVVTAIRVGVRPDGRKLSPAMPYAGFAHLTDSDVEAIVAYLRTLPPVAHQVTAPVAPGEKATAAYMTVVMPH